MRVGVIGLGKMGSQIVRRLNQANHKVISFDTNIEAINALSANGGVVAETREDLVSKLDSKPIIWLMIPSQYVGAEITALCAILPEGSIIIDGGNSDYRLTVKRAKQCQKNGINLVDIGVSGGVHGLKHGFSMMIGGDTRAVKIILPIVKSLAQPEGYGHFGPAGSGHFVKMVHNAVEYGMMQAFAEGYQLLKQGPFKHIDLARTASVWQNGSVVRSWLNQLCQEIFAENPNLKQINGVVAESGEARWALETAKKLQIDMPVIQGAFKVRKHSQSGKVNFATKILAAMRNKFGGHDINPRD